jgi:hypothetical protein
MVTDEVAVFDPPIGSSPFSDQIPIHYGGRHILSLTIASYYLKIVSYACNSILMLAVSAENVGPTALFIDGRAVIH